VGGYSKTYTNITIDGSPADWPEDAIFPGSDSSTWLVFIPRLIGALILNY